MVQPMEQMTLLYTGLPVYSSTWPLRVLTVSGFCSRETFGGRTKKYGEKNTARKRGAIQVAPSFGRRQCWQVYIYFI